MKRTLYLVHHSHTDIGYTDSQEAIKSHHVGYIKYLLNVFDDIEKGESPYSGFKYTCENFWQVEEFYRNSTVGDQKRFEKHLKNGYFEVSLTYLNMNELVDDRIQRVKFAKAKKYLNDLGVEGDCAMTADINGYSWGYAQAMYDSGIRNFYSNLHTHHGMFPLFKKQMPFWWETPNGDKLLVWNGDHYQIANTFFLTPNSDHSRCEATPYDQKAADEQFAKTEKRIYAYFDKLDQENYPHDFICEMLSGIITDNAAPNPRMMEVINRWNEKHSDTIEIKLASLKEFFEKVRSENIEIPTFKGDWPDWWADGSGSTPAYVKLYRDAQRNANVVDKLIKNGNPIDDDTVEAMNDNLMMFAEHTWGHAFSITHPWDTEVIEIDLKNGAYAANAHTQANKILYKIKEKLGEVPPKIDRVKRFKVLNPHDAVFKGYTRVKVDSWEHVDGSYYSIANPNSLEIVDVATNKVLVSQMEETTRGYAIEFPVTLQPKESIVVEIRRRETDARDRFISEHLSAGWNHAETATDKVKDLKNYGDYVNEVNMHQASTEFFDITFDENGIRQIYDKKLKKNLVRESFVANPFVGIYEKTPLNDEIAKVRRNLGRNRKGKNVERDIAKLSAFEIVSNGDVSIVVNLRYDLNGTLLYETQIKIYKQLPMIETQVRVIKTLDRAVENLYIALPFTMGEASELAFDKSGAIVRPSIDQLPGTNTDFYLLNKGFAYSDSGSSMIVLTKDAPLVTMGNLDHHEIELFEEKYEYKNHDPLYSWPMNNFWETNFKGELSGAYQFDYVMVMDYEAAKLSNAMQEMEALNEGCITFAYEGV